MANTNFNYEPRHRYDNIDPEGVLGRHRAGAVAVDAVTRRYDDISKPIRHYRPRVATSEAAPTGTTAKQEADVRTSKAERDLSAPEAFISPEGAQHLVAMVMEGRVDPRTGQLLPIEEELTLMNGPGYMTKPLPSRLRYDVVLPEQPQDRPYKDGGTLQITQNYSVSGELYQGFTSEHEISLGAADIERLAYERAKLEQTLDRRPDLTWKLNEEQRQDAYHISQNNEPAPNSDGRLVSPVRVYIPGGARGVEITNRLLEAGADFARAKIWVPQAARGEQSFREDTPIFTVNTLEQLQSVVDALRSVTTRGLLHAEANSPVGIPIEGIPGAFIAQPVEQSFNGEMADFWSEPIRKACNSLPLRAGQVVTSAWVHEAARRASAIAQRQAHAAGISPVHHALAPGQDMGVIMDAIKP